MLFLQSNGFTEDIGDWTLAERLRGEGHTVRERECIQNVGAKFELTLDDIEAADGAAVYSWSMASFWKLVDNYHPAYKLKVLFNCLGVPDWKYGQFGNLWHPKIWIERQYSFQIEAAFPWSLPYQGGAPWFDITDPQLIEKLLARPVANINCAALWPVGTRPTTMHGQSQNRSEIQDVISKILKAIQFQ